MTHAIVIAPANPRIASLVSCCRQSTGGALSRKTDLLQGTLDLLILRTLAT
jgi:hypothetical protein